MKVFDNVALNDNKYQIKIENYLFPQKASERKENLYTVVDDDFLVYKECTLPIAGPHVAQWDYLPKADLKELLQIEKHGEMRKFIQNQVEKRPKGIPRIIFRELMYTVTKYCKKENFTLEQTGAMLSQFYLTHIFFTSCLTVGAEKVYNYFKNLQLCHSLPFPPQNIKLFDLEQIRNIMIFFCRLYLRNLPLIRVMSLPNFALSINYQLEPEMKKGGKDKKGKKKGKKKRKGKKKTK